MQQDRADQQDNRQRAVLRATAAFLAPPQPLCGSAAAAD